MALLPILRYPDPRLKTVATPVTQFDDALVKLTQDMAETMYDAPGVGLAATQVNVHKRVIVIDVTEDNSGLTVFINPEIIDASKESKVYEEGCLSVPGIYEKVERPDTVKVRAQNVKGEWFEIDCDELLAVCIQHEIDHLNGKVFVEYLSQLKQTRIKSKIKKQDKLQTA
ncbi:MAG: peptide deformylase [Gammaproteobacteria bacterium]|uniref:peptide deformylase n=1 Tax=Limnobacter sp. TaxID=2003368 RepID=UPI001DD0B575|nr:peptide deformylase [Limnobacter sp.]MBU0785166.1 peptide deformylase [Gammaproteobacteria bacterium]MBU0849204.1 peptide deformylase [Gammaproteobacteria bacterium]MBU1267955.1 peptide deformylase [Gammaproteobacteria bacterium]MBU1528290.1 peptide deformylase [Gammaproteobacteria bacterium]MBU1781541.1 peptide deformylase [Gammaproteobacteria bacterium]